MPPKAANGSFDSDKEFLLRLVINAKIQVTEACKEVAEQTGEKAETLRKNYISHTKAPIEQIIMPQWTAEEERLLLLALFDRERKTGWEKDVAKILGGNFTPSSVYQRFYKLKKEADTLVNKSGSGDAGPATPTTPSGGSKSATKPKASAKSSGGGRKRTKNEAEEDEDDNVVADNTPSKKMKKGTVTETIIEEASGNEEV